MILRINVGAAVLAAAKIHSEASEGELAPLSVEGTFLAFTFPEDATVEQCVASIAVMDQYVGGLIADSDDADEIRVLGTLKANIVGIERDVRREFLYKTRARAQSAEATSDDAGSQLRAEQHTATTESPESDGALPDEKEEQEENGQAQQEGDAAGVGAGDDQGRRGSGGRRARR